MSLGLALIVLVAFVASGVAKRYFDKSAVLFQTISKEDIPLLIAASKLAKEVEGLISDGSELVLSENPLLLESAFTPHSEGSEKNPDPHLRVNGCGCDGGAGFVETISTDFR